MATPAAGTGPSLDLSIVIVNWNSREFLRKSIAAIAAHTHGLRFEIVVIDAASFDGCEEMLRSTYPGVRFIQSPDNCGFAKANNEAFKATRGRTILFLNPDTEVESLAIERLYDRLSASRRAGIAGPKLLNTDRSLQETCVRVFPTILNQAFDSDLLRRLFPGARAWGRQPVVSEDRTERAREVDAVSGACLMIKRPVFEQVGMFSTDYFMYSEDIDLCFKVRKAGLQTLYVPEAVVVHHGGASSAQAGVSKFSAVMMLESRWRYFRKTRSLFYSAAYRTVMCGSSIVRIVVTLLAWPALKMQGKDDTAAAVVKKWTARLRWTMGGEPWVKKY